MIDRLTLTHLRDLFELSNTDSNVLAKSEDDTIEYKQSFSFDEQTMKTCAAFANNRGGYIVFGIKDASRKLIGLNEKQLRNFDRLDVAKLSQKLDSKFRPSIRISKRTHRLQDLQFGVIFVNQCENKPVIATVGSGVIQDGAIYYSYGARRERIKYAELKAILEQTERRNLAKFFQHVDMVAKFGIDNTAIMNTDTGDVVGPAIGRFVIGADLVNQLKFIKEGEFQETAGAPTLKLVGTLETELGEEYVDRPTHISGDDIYREFLDQRQVYDPREYIRAIVEQSTPYTPIYYYARQAHLTVKDLKQYISQQESWRPKTVERLLERISNESRLEETMKETGSSAYRLRAKYADLFKSRSPIPIVAEEIPHIIYAVRTISIGELNKVHVLEVLKRLFDKFHGLDSNHRSNLRKAICHIDYLLNAQSQWSVDA